MNFRTTYILMGIVGVLVAALFWRGASAPKAGATGKGFLLEKMVALGTKPEDVRRIEIEKSADPKGKLVFDRDGKKGWKMVAPVASRVNGYMLDELARAMLDAKRKTRNVEIRSKASHNLEKPPVRITLVTAGDATATVSVGKLVEETNAAYVLSTDVPGDAPLVIDRFALNSILRPEEPTPPAKEPKDPKEPAKKEATPPRDLADVAALLKGVDEFRMTKLLGEVTDPLSQTQSILLRKGKEEVALTRDEGGVWRFATPAGYGEAEGNEPTGNAPPVTEINTIRKLLNTVYDLQVSTGRDFDDAPADLKKMGLSDNPDLFEVQVVKRGTDGKSLPTETISIGAAVEGQEKYYARPAGEGYVARINGAPVKSLLKVLQSPKAVRSRDLARLNIARVDAIDLEVGGVTHQLRSVNGTWSLWEPGGRRSVASTPVVQQLLEGLNRQGQILDFPPTDATDSVLGFDAAGKQGEVRIWVEGVVPEPAPKDEKKDAKKDEPKKEEGKKDEPKKDEPKELPQPKLKGEPTYRFAFGKLAGEGVYVRRTESAPGSLRLDALLPKELFTTLVRRPVFDYLDPGIRGFDVTDLTGVTIAQGADVQELTRDGIDWKFRRPEASAGRKADAARVNNVLLQLARLRPARILGDTTSAEEWKKLKVDPASNAAAVTLTFKGGPALGYYFGEPVGEGKLNVAFRSSQERFVYELPKVLLEAILPPGLSLLDPAVFRVEREKLRTIRMQGWATAETKNAPVTRELEFKDGQWSFRAEGLTLDPAKLDNFLSDALAPRAESFLPRGSFKPEYGLDPAKGALQIDFVLEGGKTVLLQLGAADADGKLIYARSSELPGEVFTLLRDRFKPVLSGPNALAK